jgi:nuclear pore complex protein Nup205
MFLLYAWTLDMLDFLHELFKLTIGREADVDAPFDTLRGRVEEMLQKRVKVGAGEGTFVDLILNQLDELQRKMAGLVNTPRTVGDEYDVLAFRIRSIRSQQGKMVGLLALVAQGARIGRGHVVKMLKWLKKTDRVDGVVTGVLA